jgi:ABC-type transport system involved in multi-copper enzyme maturation permease subunit
MDRHAIHQIGQKAQTQSFGRERATRQRDMRTIRLIWAKEVRAELYTWKSMFWLLIAALAFSVTSYLLLTNKELALLDQTELLWLLSKIIVSTALLVVSIDASSTITAEFERETAETLFVAPVRLSDMVIGKLLAVLTLWSALFAVAVPYMIVAAAGTNLALALVGYVALLGTLAVSAMALFVFAVGLLFRSSRNTLSTALIVLLGLAIPASFASTLKLSAAAQLISRINPVDSIFAALDNVLVDYQLSLASNGHFLIPVIAFLLVALGFAAFAARRFARHGIFRSIR